MSTENYGVFASLGTSQSTTPVKSSTEIVFIGAAPGGSAEINEPVIVTSLADYASKFGGAIGDNWSLTEAAEAAFSICNLDHVYMINVFDDDEHSNEADITEADIIGSASDLSGTFALQKLFPSKGVIPNIVCCPLSSSASVVASIIANITKVNGHYDGICLYDVAENANQANASQVAQTANIISAKQVSNERAIACWPHVKTVNENIISSAALMACLYAVNDASNNNIPMRSVGNVSCPSVSYLTLKSSDNAIILSEADATILSADGIISYINIGGGQYYTWGDHTSLFTNGSVSDERARFDSNIRMLFKLTNDFQLKWRSVIDSPMTLALRNDVINYEQSKLNYLVSVGALIGSPKFIFSETANTTDSLQQGEFYFDGIATVTPPAKYLNYTLSFSSEGFRVYIEQ